MITAQVNGKRVTTPGVLVVQWPDLVRLEVQDPVGGILAIAVVNGERFWLYQSEKEAILTGLVSKMPPGFLPRLSGSNLARIFLARPNLEPLRKWTVKENQGAWREQNLHETIEWDSSGELSEWNSQLADRPEIQARYENYEAKAGLRFPTRIRLESTMAQEQKKRVLIVWKDWEASAPSSGKLFAIPQDQTFGRKIKALP